jgi:hypothetical protein
MKSFLSYRFTTRKTKYLLTIGLVAAYLLGFSSRAYSPAHIGHYAVPIPRLIPVTRTLMPTQTDSAINGSSPSQTQGTTATALVFNHTNITTTYFWAGEQASADNGYIANTASAWDEQWAQHYGGQDAPAPRNGYYPAAFTPKENPFYFALPYNDIANNGKRKSSAQNCPLASQKTVYSWCKNSWIAIRHNGKTVFAQWQDVGPFEEDDTAYVFGAALPKNKQGSKAGLDVSPAVKDYLELQDVDKTDWTFVSATQVSSGPWKTIITTSTGTSVD